MVPTDGLEHAVAVLVHGLNTSPTAMDGIAQVLNEGGIRVLRVTLTGHGCHHLEELRAVTTADWLHDLLQASCIAAHYARDKHLPLYYVGYSAGGGLIVDFIQRRGQKDITFDKMVLFAPGIVLKTLPSLGARMVPLLNSIPSIARWVPSSKMFHWFLKSRNLRVPQRYTCHRGTPIAAYYARLQSIRNIQRRGLRGLNHIPTLIFLDPKDELVSKEGIQAMMQEAHLTNWRLVDVHKQHARVAHHLIIDEEAVGKEAWHTIVAIMQQHLLVAEKPWQSNGR